MVSAVEKSIGAHGFSGNELEIGSMKYLDILTYLDIATMVSCSFFSQTRMMDG